MNRVLLPLTFYIFIGHSNNVLGSSEEIKDYDEREHLIGPHYFKLGSDEYEYVLFNEPDKRNRKRIDLRDVRNYQAEINAGNKADILGTNSHYYQPDAYPDFSRRFVLQYPYKEVGQEIKDENKNKLTPKLVSPELVLKVAKESALLEAANTKNPTDDLIRKDILRTGDYWNGVWKEDVDPQVLRTKEAKKLQVVKTEIAPGSILYELVSRLRKISPTLLYVINEKRH